jgi:hypothetical protein
VNESLAARAPGGRTKGITAFANNPSAIAPRISFVARSVFIPPP